MLRLVCIALVISAVSACTFPRTALVVGGATTIAGAAMIASIKPAQRTSCEGATILCPPDINYTLQSTANGFGYLVSGMVLATRKDTQVAGLGTAAFGLLSKMASGSTTPEADVRSWENLPLFLSFAALQLPPGEHTVTVDFLDEGNRLLAGQTKTITFNVPTSAGDKVIYVSDKSSTPQNL